MGAPQAEVELVLPGCEPLTSHRLQQLKLRVVVGRTDVLDVRRPAPRGVHDLHRRGPRGRLPVRTYGDTGPPYDPSGPKN